MKSIAVCSAAVCFLCVGRAWGVADEKEAQSKKVFEMRTYIANEGKLDDLNARFRDHTTKLFEKHGIENVGYWVPTDGEAAKNTLIYIVAHKSRENAKKNWAEFVEDPDWKKASAASHKNGPLVKDIKAVYLKPTDYSKIK